MSTADAMGMTGNDTASPVTPDGASVLATVEPVGPFAEFGIRAFTTTRATGSFAGASNEPVRVVLGRWAMLRAALGPAGGRFATASQVHGSTVVVHDGAWRGWLRGEAADGHMAPHGDMSMAVTVADCTPVFLAHPSGAMALLHAGWRGVAAGILGVGVRSLVTLGFAAGDLHLHLGPSICGQCYEVGPEVHLALTGRRLSQPSPIDVRAVLADQARALGLRHITTSVDCTRCTAGRYFSHRGGDAGRQLGVMAGLG